MAGRRDRGEGSIYQRGDTGRWIARIEIGGKRVTRSASTRKEARELLAVMRRKLEGNDVPPSEQSLAAWCDEWLEYVTPDLRPNTAERYRRVCALLKEAFPRYRLCNLSVSTLQRWQTTLKRDFSPGTAALYWGVGRRILADAVKFDLLPANPAQKLDRPSVPRHEVQHLSREELAAVLNAAEGTRWHPLWVILATTGIRVGEATALTWEAFDEGAKTLAIGATMTWRKGDGLHPAEPKTPHSRRTVPLIPEAMRALQARRVAYLEEHLAAGPLWQDGNLIFGREDGAPLSRQRLAHEWHAATEAAGVPRCKPHALRHTCGTLLLEAGAPITFVQRVLGHSSATITLHVYAHHSEERAHEFMSRLSDSLDEARRKSGA